MPYFVVHAGPYRVFSKTVCYLLTGICWGLIRYLRLTVVYLQVYAGALYVI